jgi:hypothetical protein
MMYTLIIRNQFSGSSRSNPYSDRPSPYEVWRDKNKDKFAKNKKVSCFLYVVILEEVDLLPLLMAVTRLRSLMGSSGTTLWRRCISLTVSSRGVWCPLTYPIFF